ncbi:carboxypeptidase-like regulatory domain-containing protein [Acidicapsa acidisoli]|uniref:carboxypeptidase-like regulatory domain-containing protein n=1 Tax=Acidicapsa acidisoli TaxID=1615681 RepID=UPI0021E03BDD|nr:carboxypeptidase-like regulatory domain-containing protein [Acidicapsa acidisoli]
MRSQTLRNRRLSRPARPALLLVLCFLGSNIFAWSQSSTSAPSLYLPDAPEAQAASQSSAQVSPSNQSYEAQTGSIHGVVADRDGAVYQGVQITLTQAVPGPTPANTTTSDSNGQFQFSNVPPGSFKLTVSSQGFNTQIISGVLHPGESYQAPAIALAFATATSEVQVTASRVEVAQEELHEEEQQRVFGVIPNFYVVYAPDAPPLNTRQKFHLAWRSSIDPFTFAISGAFAGVEQADNGFSGYGQGAQGYAKRFGANYADSFIGTMIGSAILPSILKQDPRYFYKGTGTVRSRVLYAIANSVVCKGDNGQWQPNYSGILGSLAAGGISNLYYPASDRDGVTLTIDETLLGIAGSAAQNIFQEFFVRRFTPKLPNYQLTKP